jgi:hypothetical protein
MRPSNFLSKRHGVASNLDGSQVEISNTGVFPWPLILLSARFAKLTKSGHELRCENQGRHPALGGQEIVCRVVKYKSDVL